MAHNDTTQLVMRFGCILGGGGLPMDSGNVNVVTGQSATIVENLFYNYLYMKGPDNFVDYLIPQGGTTLFKSQDSLARIVCWAGNSDNYRAICSTIIFGALKDSLNNKNELMRRYLNYLYKRN